MRLAHLLAFLGGIVLGLAFLKWCDLVLLSAGLSLALGGGITAYRAR